MAKPKGVKAARALTVRSGVDAATIVRERDHEEVAFVDCALAEADLTNLRFVDCTFERCNLAGARWHGTGLQAVTFRDCKLLGVDFTRVRPAFLGLAFEDCQLDYTNFGGLALARTRFVRSKLVEATFIGTDLRDAVFEACDVSAALFRGTDLRGADLRGADGLVLDPEVNGLARAKVSLATLPGLLTKYQLELDD